MGIRVCCKTMTPEMQHITNGENFIRFNLENVSNLKMYNVICVWGKQPKT